jgi:hypothetical protein
VRWKRKRVFSSLDKESIQMSVVSVTEMSTKKQGFEAELVQLRAAYEKLDADYRRVCAGFEEILSEKNGLQRENWEMRERCVRFERAADAPDEVVALQEGMAELVSELGRVKEENGRFRQDWDWMGRLFSVDNQVLSSAEKLCMWWVYFYIFSLWHASNAVGQWVRVPISGRDALAQKTGLSTDTCGKALVGLHQAGLLERDAREEKGEPGKGKKRPPHTHVFAALTLTTMTPEVLRRQDGDPGRNHGGDHRLCKKCGSHKLVRQVETFCSACGESQDELKALPVNAYDPVLDGDEDRSEWCQPRVLETRIAEVAAPCKCGHEALASVQDAGRDLQHEEDDRGPRALEAVMARQKVMYQKNLRCRRCGCQLWHNVLGEWSCAKCEPGGLWPDHFLAALDVLYPAGQHAAGEERSLESG